MRYITYIFWIFIITLAVIFSTLNSHSVIIHYYLQSVRVYLPLLLLITLIMGALLGTVVLLPTVWRAKGANRKLRNQIKQLEQEIGNLRKIPLEDDH